MRSVLSRSPGDCKLTMCRLLRLVANWANVSGGLG